MWKGEGNFSLVSHCQDKQFPQTCFGVTIMSEIRAVRGQGVCVSVSVALSHTHISGVAVSVGLVIVFFQQTVVARIKGSLRTK